MSLESEMTKTGTLLLTWTGSRYSINLYISIMLSLDLQQTLFKTSKENVGMSGLEHNRSKLMLSLCVDIPGLTLPQTSGKSEDDDEEDEDEEMEVEEPSPRKQSPKKPVSSRKRNLADAVAEKSPKKRRQDPSPQTSPVKGGGKPACKYGLKCYQTNAAHRSKFSHPVREIECACEYLL